MLNLHPNIAMVPAEMHFFDKIDHYDKGLEWYRRHMPLTTVDQLVVEKSPSYYVTPEGEFFLINYQKRSTQT